MLTARMANKRNENKQTLSAETDHALSSGSAGGKNSRTMDQSQAM